MSINVSVSSKQAGAANSALKTVGNAAKVAKVLGKMAGHNSITKMANDGIYQYPVLMSSNMNSDDAITIARALEKYYAALVVTSYSLYGTMPDSKYADIGDFTKKFHSNSDIPTNFRAAKNALESNTNINTCDGTFALESAIARIESNPLLKEVADQCWGFATEQLDMESLNSIYQPYLRTSRIIEEKLSDMKAANESAKSIVTGVNNFLSDAADLIQHEDDKSTGDANIGLYDADAKSQNKKVVQKTDKSAKFEVVRNDKLSALEPTMVNVTITRHGVNTGNGPSVFLQQITLGVKAMVRLVRSDLMVANMVEAAKNANAIFKFIRWTKGEIKLVRDFIFGISEAKAAATANNSMELRVLKSAKKRKSVNNISKFLNNEVLPSLAIIMTTSEVEQVKNICGVDLSQLYNALKLMNKYYLLGFGVYDTVTQSIQILFDGDDDFAYTTIGNMKSQENKDMNLTNTKDVLRMMGRI